MIDPVNIVLDPDACPTCGELFNGYAHVHLKEPFQLTRKLDGRDGAFWLGMIGTAITLGLMFDMIAVGRYWTTGLRLKLEMQRLIDALGIPTEEGSEDHE